MLRLMIKIILLPLALVLNKAVSLLLLGVANLSTYVLGLVIMFMIGCGIYSVTI